MGKNTLFWLNSLHGCDVRIMLRMSLPPSFGGLFVNMEKIVVQNNSLVFFSADAFTSCFHRVVETFSLANFCLFKNVSKLFSQGFQDVQHK